jgi:hypothetical protein
MKHMGPFEVYVHYFNAQINVTPKIDKLFRKSIFLGGIAKLGGGHLLQSYQSFLRTLGSLRLPRALNPMASKEN